MEQSIRHWELQSGLKYVSVISQSDPHTVQYPISFHSCTTSICGRLKVFYGLCDILGGLKHQDSRVQSFAPLVLVKNKLNSHLEKKLQHNMSC